MKNLDLTITGPQGEGKTSLAASVIKMFGFACPRILSYNKPLYLKDPRDLAEELREEAADVIIFDAGFTDARELAIAAKAVSIYREITNRKVAAVYCANLLLTDIVTL